MSEPTETRDSRYLPTEGNLREHFRGSHEELVGRIFDAMARYTPFIYPDERFKLVRPENVPSFIGSPVASLHFLEFIVGLLQPKRILEVGTYTGLATLYMASSMPADGEIVTLEKYPLFAQTAKQNFEANGKSAVIRCLAGDAWESLSIVESEGAPFDLIFLDGNKERYGEYFPRLLPLLGDGGLFIADNAFAQGDVLNGTPVTEKGKGVTDFLERCKELDNWRRFLLPFIDGSLFMYKVKR